MKTNRGVSLFLIFILYLLLPNDLIGQDKKIIGYVKGHKGENISGAEVYINDVPTTSLPDGSFSQNLRRISDEPITRFHVVVIAKGYTEFRGPMIAELVGDELRLSLIRLNLAHPGQTPFSGRVVNEDGEGISGATVVIEGFLPLQTNENGIYSEVFQEKIDVTNNEFSVRVTIPEYEQVIIPRHRLKMIGSQALFDDITLRLKKQRIYHGRVIDKKGNGIGDVIVTPDCFNYSVSTDEQGNFSYPIDSLLQNCGNRVSFTFSPPGKKYKPISKEIDLEPLDQWPKSDPNELVLPKKFFRLPFWIISGTIVGGSATGLYFWLRPLPKPNDNPIR